MHLDTVKHINNESWFPAKFQKTLMHIQRLWKADNYLGAKYGSQYPLENTTLDKK